MQLLAALTTYRDEFRALLLPTRHLLLPRALLHQQAVTASLPWLRASSTRAPPLPSLLPFPTTMRCCKPPLASAPLLRQHPSTSLLLLLDAPETPVIFCSDVSVPAPPLPLPPLAAGAFGLLLPVPELRGDHALAAAASEVQDKINKVKEDPVAGWNFFTLRSLYGSRLMNHKATFLVG